MKCFLSFAALVVLGTGACNAEVLLRPRVFLDT